MAGQSVGGVQRQRQATEGKRETYRQQTDGVDGQLINLAVTHDCGVSNKRLYHEKQEEVGGNWERRDDVGMKETEERRWRGEEGDY